MATTAKELKEILEKYTDPDEIVIWQYYTLTDFDGDISQKEFATIVDQVERWELWTGARDTISEAIWQHENTKEGKNE